MSSAGLRRGRLAFALFLWLFAGAEPCSAQPVSVEERQEIELKLNQAREAMAAGDFPRAVQLYNEVVLRAPLPGVQMNLGMAHFMAGHYRLALTHLRTAVQRDPALTPGWLFTGASLVQLGQFDEAIEPLERYLERQPDDIKARQMLADALLQGGDPAAATEHFEAVTQAQPDNPQGWLGLGRSYEMVAQQAFDDLDRRAPGSVWWLALVAELRLAQQQYQSAFYFFRQVVEKQPGTRGVHVAISRIYDATGHPDWAQKELEKEQALGVPNCEEERLLCDFLAGRHREILKSVLGRDSEEAKYWISRAANQLARGAFTRLTRLPPSFELHQFLADIQSSRGRHREAADQWELALQLSPGNPLARRHLAIELYLSRDYETAKPLIDALLEESPGSAEFHFLAGDIRLNQQQAEEALPLLNEALRLDPGLDSARSSLGRALVELGRFEEAIPALEASLESDRDGSIHFQLARAYSRTGRSVESGKTLALYQQIQQQLQQEGSKVDEETQITPPD